MRRTSLIAMVLASLLAQGCLFGNGEGVGEKPPSANGTAALNDPIIYSSASIECSGTDEIGYASDNTITYADGCTGKTQTLTSSQVGLSYLGAIATYQSTPFQLQTPVEGLDPAMVYTALFCGNDSYGVFVDTMGQGSISGVDVTTQTFCANSLQTTIYNEQWVFQNTVFSLSVDYLHPNGSSVDPINATLQIVGTPGTQNLTCDFNQSSSPGPTYSCKQ